MASYLPDDFIDSLREQTDLVAVINQYVPLKKRGQTWVGLCPFHTEKTPSFTVTPGRGIFKCFGCGKGGDVYSFLMEHQKLTFSQACELLAERAGIPLPKAKVEQQEDSARKRLFYAHEFARGFYHDTLTGSQDGQPALEYLTGRGLDRELIDEFALGWSGPGRETFKKAALQHGLEEEDLIVAGLLTRAEDSGETFDRFRSRVMFPIRDTRGRTVGFGGRVLDDSQPKYLNTADTPLFHKGELLFGLDRARGEISRKSSAVIVEGYMDLLSLWQHGVHDVVAPLGTALTAEQARLVGRYAREVFLLYDADAAGLKATFRGGDELLEAGVNVRVATLPRGFDPDDFIRKKGEAAYRELLAAAGDFLDRKIEILGQRLDLDLVSEREKAADKCLETVARCRDELVRNLYLKKTAEFIGVPESVLAERLSRIRSQSPRRPGPGRVTAAGARPGGNTEKGDEFFLLAVCLNFPTYVGKTVELLGEEPFRKESHRAVFAALREAVESGVRNLVEALYSSLSEQLHPLVGSLREYQEVKEIKLAEKSFDESWRNIRIGQIELEMKENKIRFAGQEELLNQAQKKLRAEKKQVAEKSFRAFWREKI